VSFLAIDPGNEFSALVELDDDLRPIWSLKTNNEAARERIIRARLRGAPAEVPNRPPDHLVVEMIASYGMPVGREVFETCLWIGRFVECWCGPFTLVYRREVKSFLCGDSKARDANIRQALLDRYGGKDKAVGKSKTPGPLHGLTGDLWQALAVGVTWHGTRRAEAA
jgi:hypothetical protein